MFDQILLAVDGSDHSRKAVDAAVQAAKLGDGKVTVLHVIECEVGRGAARYESQDEADRVVTTTTEQLERAGVATRGEVLSAPHGQVAAAITDEAAVQGCDLIVMGSYGRNDLVGLFRGSTAHKVLRHASQPVLLAR